MRQVEIILYVVLRLLATIFSALPWDGDNVKLNVWGVHFNVASDIITICGVASSFVANHHRCNDDRHRRHWLAWSLSGVALIAAVADLLSRIGSTHDLRIYTEFGRHIFPWWVGSGFSTRSQGSQSPDPNWGID
jgi:hypothetical protein